MPRISGFPGIVITMYTAAHRPAPAGAQFQRRIGGDDAFLTCPGEEPPQGGRNRALGAPRSRVAVLQGQAPDRRVEIRQVQIAHPGVAESGNDDEDAQAGPPLATGGADRSNLWPALASLIRGR